MSVIKDWSFVRLSLITLMVLLAAVDLTDGTVPAGTADYTFTTLRDSYDNMDSPNFNVTVSSNDNRDGHGATEDDSSATLGGEFEAASNGSQTEVSTTEVEPAEDFISSSVSSREGSGSVGPAGKSGLQNINAAATFEHYVRCAATGDTVPNPCRAGYKCVLKSGRVQCLPIDFCDGSCSSHGTCVYTSYSNHGTTYRCECNPGYWGRDCEFYIAMDPTQPPIVSRQVCNPSPCKGDCTCLESCKHEGGYFCSSPGGFIGKNCNIPVPKVHCGANSISVDIPGELYEEFDKGLGNSYFYVSPHYARKESLSVCEAFAVDGDYRITISLPFAACGTKREKSGAYTFISNKVFIDRRTDLFSVAVPVIELECRYEKQYQLVTSLKPVINLPSVIGETSSFEPLVQLCKDSSCPLTCPTQYKVTAGAVYTVGEMIHINVVTHPTVHMNNFLGYVTSVNRMALSCSRRPPVVTDLHLINNGCVANTGFLVTSKAGRVACVELQTPRGINCDSVYIHMHLVMCKPHELKTCKNGEVKRCPLPARRKRRSATMFATTMGPLVFLNGSIGEERIELYPGAALTGKSLVFTKGQLNDLEESDDLKQAGNDSLTDDNDKGLLLAIAAPGAALLVFVLLLLFAWYNMSASVNARRCRSLLANESSHEMIDHGETDTCVEIPLVIKACGADGCRHDDAVSCRYTYKSCGCGGSHTHHESTCKCGCGGVCN